jgi:DoxX-like protein
MATAIQAQSATASKKALWASRAMRIIVVLFLLMDASIHIATPAPVVQAMNQLGYPLDVTVTIGIIELALTVLYVIPRTSIFGALLLTGYLGGAVAAHMRVGNPVFESYIFPVLMGALLWGGLVLIDSRLRGLLTTAKT